MLLELGLSPQQRNGAGELPIHIAAGLWQAELVQFYLDSGVDANVRDAADRTPLWHLQKSTKSPWHIDRLERDPEFN